MKGNISLLKAIKLVHYIFIYLFVYLSLVHDLSKMFSHETKFLANSMKIYPIKLILFLRLIDKIETIIETMTKVADQNYSSTKANSYHTLIIVYSLYTHYHVN